MMKKQLDIIEDLCKKIKNKRNLYDNKLEGIILTGSLAQGKSHPNSDIDIHIIINSSDFSVKHICKMYEDTIVQIQIYSILKFKKECMEHNKKRPAICVCKILFDDSGKCQEILHLSQKYEMLGPQKMTVEEKQIIITKIKTEILTAQGLILKGNAISALLIIDQTVKLVIEYYNDEHNYWMSNDNYLFDEFEEHDNELGKIAKRIIVCNNPKIKLSLLNDLCLKSISDFHKKNIEYYYEVE